MSRLYDRLILRAGSMYTPFLKSVPVIVVDNVTKYMYEDCPQEDWGFDDFPNIAPPFSGCFIETKAPQIINSEKYGVLKWNKVKQGAAWGALMYAVDLRTPEGRAFADATMKVRFRSVKDYMALDMVSPQQMIDCTRSSRWLSVFRLVLEMGNNAPEMTPIDLNIFVDEDGSVPIYAQNFHAQFIAVPSNPQFSPEQGRKLVDEIGAFFKPFFLALCFMNCKNVVMKDGEINPKLDRSHTKKHGVPLVRYKVLEIEPMRRIFKEAHAIHGFGSPKALHICRGHFKTFSKEKPLLGRATGTFWWSQQVRGHKDKGIIIKDYALKSPSLPEVQSDES